MSDDPGRLVEIRILGLPLAAWLEAQEHTDGLRREFTLLNVSDHDGRERHEPRQLLEVIAEIEADYEGMNDEQDRQLFAAAEQGAESIDITYFVPAVTAEACRRLEEVMDAADRYCLDGELLLSLVTPPNALAFRRWYLGEFVAQIEGAEPTSWATWLASQA